MNKDCSIPNSGVSRRLQQILSCPQQKCLGENPALTLVNLILVTEINLLSAYLSKGMEMAVGYTFPALIQRPTSHLFSWPSHSHRNISFSSCPLYVLQTSSIDIPKGNWHKKSKKTCISACGGWSPTLQNSTASASAHF